MGQLSSKHEEVSDVLMLRIAAKEGHTEVVEVYLQKNPALALHVSSKDGSTVVHAACEVGQHAILQQLLCTLRLSAASNTFDPLKRIMDLQDSKGRTALALAAGADAHGHLLCAGMLVQAGCSVWLQDRAGCTCLHTAALQGSSRFVTLILQAAAKQQPSQQQLPLAPGQQQPRQLQSDPKVLMHRIANMADAAGRTALHYAVQSGDLETIHLLLTAGAALTTAASCDALEHVPVNQGGTPLHLAASRGDTAAAVLILTAYLTAASGELPELTQPCHCTCGWNAHGAVACGGSGSCCCDAGSAVQLQDPRTVRDSYGLMPHLLAAAGPEQSSLRQLLGPHTTIAEALETLSGAPRTQQGSRAVVHQQQPEQQVEASAVPPSYQQLVRALSSAGNYLARQRALQQEAKQAVQAVQAVQQVAQYNEDTQGCSS